MSGSEFSDNNAGGGERSARDAERSGKPTRNGSLWAHEGAPIRRLEFKKHDFDFENAVDIEKIEALLAWNGHD